MLAALIYLPDGFKVWRLYSGTGTVDGPRFLAAHDGGYSAALGRLR